ncbi:MAG: hypothetical protein M5U19_16780 [Microthrixaceae bacterium]|nr:hypothetical protein [Microthrixaceae bacterium]
MASYLLEGRPTRTWVRTRRSWLPIQSSGTS